MLYRAAVAALAGGLALYADAIPLAQDGVPAKREIPDTHVVHERHMPPVAQTWTKKKRFPAGEILPMRIGLKQVNLEAGHNKLMDL